MLPSPSNAVVQPDLRALRRAMADSFNLDEIKLAAFELRIDYDNLAGDIKDTKILELIKYTERYGMLQSLVAYVQRARPHLKLQQEVPFDSPSLLTPDQRAEERRTRREKYRNIYVVHTLRPSPGRDGWYDILIYLKAHKRASLDQVSFAEFFLGSMWENHVFRVGNQDGFIGINISAYGPVLCTCRVLFSDGYETLLERYIDFEMAGSVSKYLGG